VASVGLFRWALAFFVGVTLFAALPEHGYLVLLRAEDQDNFLLGVIGSVVIGTTLVFVAGRPLALVLCFLCPLVGVAAYEFLGYGTPGFDRWTLVFYTTVYSAFAMVGGGMVAFVFKVDGWLKRRRSRTS
jgi:hypothetical protein